MWIIVTLFHDFFQYNAFQLLRSPTLSISKPVKVNKRGCRVIFIQRIAKV